MPGDVIQYVLYLLILAFGAGFEEVLPKFLGVGFPVLLTAVQFSAARQHVLPTVLFAIAAGAAEDSISSLAPMTSASYFVIVALVVRRFKLPRLMTVLTYPCYQVWLAVWTIGLGGSVFNRILLSFPIGLLTAFSVGAILAWTYGKAAIDERG